MPTNWRLLFEDLPVNPDTKKEEWEPEIFVKLVYEGPKRIKLIALDQSGRFLSCGNLLTIDHEGVVMLHGGVNSSLGLPGNKLRVATGNH